MTFFQKMLDSIFLFSYNEQVSHKLWPHGQSVKTSPFHGGVRGSTPLEATKGENGIFARFRFFFKKQKPRPNICFRPFATKRNSCFTSSWSRLIARKQVQRRFLL